MLKRTPVQQPAQITLSLSFVYHVDLPETWSDLKKALGQLAPKNTVLSQLLGKALLHNISTESRTRELCLTRKRRRNCELF